MFVGPMTIDIGRRTGSKNVAELVVIMFGTSMLLNIAPSGISNVDCLSNHGFHESLATTYRLSNTEPFVGILWLSL